MELEVTESDVRRFAPRARQEYVSALVGGLEYLREAGVLENELRLCHFMAQVGHETDGFTIIRESLSYKTPARLRAVWPSRFRNKSDSELAKYINDGLTLGDAVYGGRMGNNKGGDGYAYRGGGFLQTTGKEAVNKYAAALGITPSSALLDDIPTTLRFACFEWQASGCCVYADDNDIMKVSKAINTGSATSNVQPVGMDGRREWFDRAWKVWGERPLAALDRQPTDGGKPSFPTLAVQSKSFWLYLQGMVATVLGFFTSGLETVASWVGINITPDDPKATVMQAVDTGKEVASYLSVSKQAIIVPFLLLIATVMIVRHIKDKGAN